MYNCQNTPLNTVVCDGPLECAPDGRFSYVLCCGAKRLDNILPRARDFHIDTITNKLVDERDDVKAVAAQFVAFKKGIETKTEMEKTWRNLHFCGNGKARGSELTKKWRAALTK
jgi:hypothetical protein